MQQIQEHVKSPAPGLRQAPGAPGVADGWTTDLGTVVRGDAMTVLATLEDESFSLVFADPPFNLGKTYGVAGLREDDRWSVADYLDWCRGWADELVRVLAPGGSAFIYNLPRWNAHLAAHLDGRLRFRHSIAVDMKYSLPVRGRLYPAHYSLLYMTKGKPKTFAPPRVPMTTCPACGKELKDYGGHKAKLNPAGFNLSDVWSDLSPVRHPRYKSRTGNQLPLKMLDRILEIASEPGDRILDPFAGSGTSLVAAELLRRRWYGIEIVELDPIVARLADLEPERDTLRRAQSDKNRLFTERALQLRKLHKHDTSRYRMPPSSGA
jgi:site-specific DNA-methyltransferase (adenine-specific)